MVIFLRVNIFLKHNSFCWKLFVIKYFWSRKYWIKSYFPICRCKFQVLTLHLFFCRKWAKHWPNDRPSHCILYQTLNVTCFSGHKSRNGETIITRISSGNKRPLISKTYPTKVKTDNLHHWSTNHKPASRQASFAFVSWTLPPSQALSPRADLFYGSSYPCPERKSHSLNHSITPTLTAGKDFLRHF